MANFINVNIELTSATVDEFFDKHLLSIFDLPKMAEGATCAVHYMLGGDDWNIVKPSDNSYYPYFVGSCDCQLGIIIIPEWNEFYVVHPGDYFDLPLSLGKQDELLRTLIHYPEDKIIAKGNYSHLFKRRRLPLYMTITSVNKDYKANR